MAVLAPASVTFSYPAIALFYRGFLIACSVFPALLDQQTSEPPGALAQVTRPPPLGPEIQPRPAGHPRPVTVTIQHDWSLNGLN